MLLKFTLSILLLLAFVSSERADDYDDDDGYDEDGPNSGRNYHSGRSHHSGRHHHSRRHHHSGHHDRDRNQLDEPDISTEGDHYDDQDNHEDDYDHDSVLGSHKETEEFKEITPDEAKARLGILVNKMDSNNNGNITKDELQKWIVESFKELDIDNAKSKMTEFDTNKDNMITWDEYINKHYGYSELDIDKFEKEKNKDMESFLHGLKSEKIKFSLADTNKTNTLDLQELVAFLHPSNYPHMAPFEIGQTLEDYDKNKNGFVEFTEFVYDNQTNMTKAEKEKEQKHFNEYDLNKDGKLDKKEIQLWTMPGFEKAALTEVNHLFKETDENKDSVLTKEEIVKKHELWVGSHATNFGQKLDDAPIKDEL